MAAQDPTHPDRPASVRLTPTDISGGASTIGDELTVGTASIVKALANGFGPSRGSTSLLARYAAMQKQRAQDEAAAKARAPRTPEETERRALRKSAKHFEKRVRQGMAPSAALLSAHRRYKAKGGKSTYAPWAKKLAGG